MRRSSHTRPAVSVARVSAVRGFTLLEVLLVLGIMVVIMAMVVPNLLGRQTEALVDQAEIQIKSIESAATQYAVGHSAQYPESLQELVEPTDEDGKPMKSYIEQIPMDPWKNEFKYELADGADEKPTISSAGPDKQFGTDDDITNKDRDRSAR